MAQGDKAEKVNLPFSTVLSNMNSRATKSAQDSIDVLNEQGIKTGEVLSRSEIHRQGKVHRAVHLYLLDGSGQLLLQRRSRHVDHYPGMFSISVTGHVDAGECSSEAVYRELEEELGINAAPGDITFLFSYRQDVHLSPTYIDRQFNDIYVFQRNFKLGKLHFAPQTISELKLVSLEAFEQLITDASSEIAPVYQEQASHIVALLKKFDQKAKEHKK